MKLRLLADLDTWARRLDDEDLRQQVLVFTHAQEARMLSHLRAVDAEDVASVCNLLPRHGGVKCLLERYAIPAFSAPMPYEAPLVSYPESRRNHNLW